MQTSRENMERRIKKEITKLCKSADNSKQALDFSTSHFTMPTGWNENTYAHYVRIFHRLVLRSI